MAFFGGEKLICIRGERTVFAGLDFGIDAGGALMLIGHNGSGKSSLLRLMAGLLAPAAGRMTWDGEDVKEDPEAHRGRMHYVGHLDAIKPVLSVVENLDFWARMRKDDGETGFTVGEALETLGIAHLADVPGRFLSAGQKRRVNLARILASRAPIWLLDEPTTALDKAAIKSLEAAMQRHRDGGGMIVLSTHTDVDLPGCEVLDVSNFTLKGAAP